MTLEALREPARVARSKDRTGTAGWNGRDRSWWPYLVVGWIVQIGLRLVLAAGQSTPAVTPDEMGYLFAGRLLADGLANELPKATYYRGGYSLLIVPAFWLSDDARTVYRIVIAVNAVVAALIFVLAYRLLRRLELTPGRAYAVAHVTALLPAGVFYTQYAMADAVLPVVVLGWLLLLHSWLVGDADRAADRGRAALHGAGAGLLAGYAYMVHSRGVVIVAVQAGLLLFVAVRRLRPWRSAGLSALIMAGTAGVGWSLNTWIWLRLYPQGSWDMSALLAQRLTTAEGLAWTVPVGLGQIWYVITSTWGMAGIGLVAAVAVAVRRETPSTLRALAIVVVVLVAGIAFATAAALPDERRVGNHAYGRYLACLAPTLFAVGAAVLMRAARRNIVGAVGLVAVLMVAGAALIDLHAGERFGDYKFLSFDFPEMGFLSWDWTSFRLWWAVSAALGLLVSMTAVSFWPRCGAGLLVATLAVVNTMASAAAASQISRPVNRDMAAASDLNGVARPGAKPRVAIDQRIAWRIRAVQSYQIGWSEVLWFDGARRRPPARADLVLIVWGTKVPAHRTWTDPPAGWRIAHARRSGGWVAWARG